MINQDKRSFLFLFFSEAEGETWNYVCQLNVHVHASMMMIWRNPSEKVSPPSHALRLLKLRKSRRRRDGEQNARTDTKQDNANKTPLSLEDC